MNSLRHGKLIFYVTKCTQICSRINCIAVNARFHDSWSNKRHFSRHYVRSHSDDYSDHQNQNPKWHGASMSSIFGPIGAFLGLYGSDENKDEQIPELIMTIKRSILLTQKGEFERAEQMLHVALREAQLLQNFDAVTYIYDLMANLAYDTEKYEKAHNLFVSVLQRLMSNGSQQNDMRVIHISLKIADCFEHTGDIEKAEDGYQFCLGHLNEHYRNDPKNEDVVLLLAITSKSYGHFLLSQAKYTDAFKYFLQAYDLSIDINGEVHEQTVLLLNDLGTVCSKTGDDNKALSYLLTAAEIGKKLPDMCDLGAIYVNIGTIYIKKGLYKEAETSCRKGWKLSKSKENQESLAEAKICLENIKLLS